MSVIDHGIPLSCPLFEEDHREAKLATPGWKGNVGNRICK